MSAPTKKCPFKNNAGDGIACEGTACMAYDLVNETCKLLIVTQAKIDFKDGGIDGGAVASNINNA